MEMSEKVKVLQEKKEMTDDIMTLLEIINKQNFMINPFQPIDVLSLQIKKTAFKKLASEIEEKYLGKRSEIIEEAAAAAFSILTKPSDAPEPMEEPQRVYVSTKRKEINLNGKCGSCVHYIPLSKITDKMHKEYCHGNCRISKQKYKQRTDCCKKYENKLKKTLKELVKEHSK